MRIAELAPLWLPIPPNKSGGTERAINCITEGLVQEGNEVALIASGGSHTDGRLIEVMPKSIIEMAGSFNFKSVEGWEFLSYSKLIDHQGEFDIIHNHMSIHPLVFSKVIKAPFVTTYHSSVAPDYPYLADEFRDCMFVSLSNSQRKLAPQLNWVATIPNPVDTDLYKPNFGKTSGYLLFLGALNQNKGLDWAVDAAIETGLPLIIAGNFMNDVDKLWFEDHIRGKIDGKKIQFVGEVDNQQKQELFANADAFLCPSSWNEAFGLVIIEALACGTPVIGSNNGAIPEIIKHGETGFVADNYDDFVKYIGSVEQISRKACREEVERNYSIKKVAGLYSNLFGKILGAHGQ